MKTFHEIIFNIGAKLRNPSLLTQFELLKKSEKYSREELVKSNHDELKRFIRFAYEKSPFYKSYFDKNKFDPFSDWRLSDFNQLPAISKADLINNNASVHTDVIDNEKWFECETSGTSGQILTFKRDELWDSFNRAAIWRGYSWFGVNPWDYKLYFWGYNSNRIKRLKVRFFDFLVNRFRIFDYNPDSMAKISSKLKNVQLIEGYSSMVYELAKINQNQKLNFTNLKLVKGTSEKIFEHYQDLAQEVYKKKIVSEYGSAESGIIAFECKEGSMHITLEGVYLSKDPVDGGVLVTNLKSRSFPIINYALGDLVTFAPEGFVCACGMNHPVLSEITGRIGKLIYGESRTYPSFTLYYVFKNLYFNKHRKFDFQVHQFKKGKLEIWVKEKVTNEVESLILDESLKYFTDVKISIVENHDFRQEKGKLKDFISHLN